MDDIKVIRGIYFNLIEPSAFSYGWMRLMATG